MAKEITTIKVVGDNFEYEVSYDANHKKGGLITGTKLVVNGKNIPVMAGRDLSQKSYQEVIRWCRDTISALLAFVD